MASTKARQQRALSKIAEEESPSSPVPLARGRPSPPRNAAHSEDQPAVGAGPDHLRHCFVPADENGCLGLHLSRTPWDPYPWVSGIVEGSCADLAGVRVGDCVLEANGEDLLGLKVVDIAKRVRSRRMSRSSPAGVGLLLWNSGFEKNNLNPQSLSRFANCLQGIAGLLECPICLEVIRPPSWQCTHGHLICSGCRSKTTKCPICREVLGRGRCIVADKLFHYLVQTLGHEADRPPMDPNSPAVANRRRPLMLREFQRHPSQHQPHKHAVKLKANTGPNGTPPALGSPPAFHCPSGQPCARMKNQHDILIHLQKAHQTSVVQYYVTGGDTVDVALTGAGSSLPCVALLPTSTTPAKATNSDGPDASTDADAERQPRSTRSHELFFVTTFRPLEQPGETLCWLWHLGDGVRSERFQVHLIAAGSGDDRLPTPGGSGSWQGGPVPLEWGCQEVLRSKQYARLSGDARSLRVRIVQGSEDRGGK